MIKNLFTTSAFRNEIQGIKNNIWNNNQKMIPQLLEKSKLDVQKNLRNKAINSQVICETYTWNYFFTDNSSYRQRYLFINTLREQLKREHQIKSNMYLISQKVDFYL